MPKIFTLDECFRLLGLDPNKNYTATEIKKVYKKLALKYHPDKNPDDACAEDFFKKIKEAYETVTNPAFVNQIRKKITELNVIVNFTISFDDGFFGKNFPIHLNANTLYYKENNFKFDIEFFEFGLPPGSSGTVEHLFSGKGFRKGDDLGDLLIRINILPHRQFHLEGKNVISRVPVPLTLLIKGGNIDVATMYGVKELLIPPGTKPESALNIPDCGVSESHFHIAILELIFPSKEDLKSEEWKDFGINWDLS